MEIPRSFTPPNCLENATFRRVLVASAINVVLSLIVFLQVNLLRKMCGEWIRHFRSSLLSQNTTRRFVSTVSGTMISFPPQAMKLGYDPVIEKWFHGAFTHPGKIILTPPMSSQTDLSIVTLSHSVFNGKAKEMHTPADRISAVMGLQVTGHYLYALTVDLVPACQTVGIRCFLMTDGGYVVAHPKVNLFSESGGPMERFHVTHIESVWSTEMLAGKHPLLKKDVCYDLSSGEALVTHSCFKKGLVWLGNAKYTSSAIMRLYSHASNTLPYIMTRMVPV